MNVVDADINFKFYADKCLIVVQHTTIWNDQLYELEIFLCNHNLLMKKGKMNFLEEKLNCTPKKR